MIFLLIIFFILISSYVFDGYAIILSPPLQTQSPQSQPSFGLLFDIDGVIVRGQNVLPSAPEAFSKLVDKHGRFRIPTVFVTNAGNALRNQKAEQLSNWLGVEVKFCTNIIINY